MPNSNSKKSDNDRLRVESPCRRQCCLDDQDVCLGCGRSLPEILQWSVLDSNERLAVRAAAEQRLQANKRAH